MKTQETITTEQLEELTDLTGLQKSVITDLKEMAEDERSGYLEDLLQHGCQSGMVTGLIYYADTLPYFKDHRREIRDLLAEAQESIGVDSPKGLFGDKWEDNDPFADDTNNQNLLAWFGYEEAARIVASSLGLEI